MERFFHNTAFSKLLGRLVRNEGGAAAIEFSFIAPVLIVMILGVVDVGRMAVQVANMETALRAGVQYALNSGTDMSVAKNVASQAWTGKPSNGILSAQNYCMCSGSVASCSQPCVNGAYPQNYFTISASGQIGGTFLSSQKSMTNTVRLQ